jgi:aspartyl-tRNA synthetase
MTLSTAHSSRHRYRSHTCAQLRDGDAGSEVRLSGWCHRIRDHGGVLFIDLRDHYGLTQIVIDPASPAFAIANTLRAEWVIKVDGAVRLRPDGTQNTDLPTGLIEVYATEIEVLGAASELPMPVFGDLDYPEDVRLTYRFLDLRREKLHNNIMTRVKVIDSMRTRMKTSGFNEFATPILTASSPEGARDFLVPSRLHAGKFYALPQAPQQYKQLLMMAGFDVEMSFVEQEDIFNTMEPVIAGIFEEFGKGRPVTPSPWPRIPYAVSMQKYGSDKPDLRNRIEMQDVSEHFRGSGFKVFARILEDEKNRVWAIPAQTAGAVHNASSGIIGRGFCDRMNAWAQGEGQTGLGYIIYDFGIELSDDEKIKAILDKYNGIARPDIPIIAKGPIANNVGSERSEAIRQQMGLSYGDACFFVAGDPEKFVKFAGLARTKIGEDLNLIDKNRFEFAWIVDFPMYEWNEDEKKVDFSHNPFSMPQGGMDALQNQDPLTIKAFQYDIACNGFELASGGIRNHKPEAMVKAFEIAGYGEETVIARFGGMYRAFQYGAPPHGGMAAGIDRIIMLLCDAQNLREVALFPMNQSALDLLMGAPAEVSLQQLRELHMKVNMPAKS